MKTSLDWEARPAGQQEWEGNNMMQVWEGDRIAMHCEASDLQTINHDSKIGRGPVEGFFALGHLPYSAPCSAKTLRVMELKLST